MKTLAAWIALAGLSLAETPTTAEETLKRLNEPDGHLDAVKALEEDGLSIEECAKVIRGLPGINAEGDASMSRAARVLEKLRGRADPAFLPAIVDVYDKLDQLRARSEALELVAKVPGDAAAQTFLGLLKRQASSDMTPLWSIRSFGVDRFPKYLPELIQVAPLLEGRVEIFAIVLEQVEAGKFDFGAHADQAKVLVQRMRVLCEKRRDALDAAYGKRGLRVPDEEEEKKIPALARRAHDELEYLLDLAGHLEVEGVDDVLKAAATLPATTLRIFAVGSMLKRGGTLPAELLEKLAERPSERALLYQVLDSRDGKKFFPKKFLNQADMAVADMVRWLEYGTELGHTTPRIEPLAVVDFKNEKGKTRRMRFFRFQGSGDPDKWYVGVSGAYRVDDADVEDDGRTFSNFTELGEKSLDEHIAEYVDEEIVKVTPAK